MPALSVKATPLQIIIIVATSAVLTIITVDIATTIIAIWKFTEQVANSELKF